MEEYLSSDICTGGRFNWITEFSLQARHFFSDRLFWRFSVFPG